MRQNAPYTETPAPVTAYKFGAFDQYVSFCALGGLITSDDGELSKMTVSQFCQQWGIDRKTTYRWRQTLGFGDRIRARREELFPLARETACWNRLYLIALQSNDYKAAVQACIILLGHFSGLMLPARRQPQPANQGNSWTELLLKAREKGVIDD
jgi:hypothetical protein